MERTRGFAGTATPTPDDLFDYWLPRLTDPELRALLYLVRRTLGSRERAEAISLRQFLEGARAGDGRVLDEGCGIRNRSTLTRALEGLQARGLLIGERRSSPERGDLATLYRLVFDDEAGRGDLAAPGSNSWTRGVRGADAGGTIEPGPRAARGGRGGEAQWRDRDSSAVR